MSDSRQKVLPYPVIVEEECKGCGRCIDACPKQVLRSSRRVNRRGYIFAEYSDSGCTGCAICYYNCPEPYAIEIHKKEKE
jgi:2-oxoisovalerate ferredoxin oxidoreductase delta subunit